MSILKWLRNDLCIWFPYDIYIYTIYLHCRRIYNLFVLALETGRKQTFSEIFMPVSQRVQINFYI